MQDAMGAAVADFARSMPDTTTGLVVVTHSRPLARRLVDLDTLKLRVGDDLRPTAEWIGTGPLPGDVHALESLGAVSSARYRAVQAALEARRTSRAPHR